MTFEETLYGIINLIVVLFTFLFFTKKRFRFLEGSTVREWSFQGSIIFFVFFLLSLFLRIPVVIFRQNESIHEQALGYALMSASLFVSFLVLTIVGKSKK